jgi:hypothetical protein
VAEDKVAYFETAPRQVVGGHTGNAYASIVGQEGEPAVHVGPAEAEAAARRSGWASISAGNDTNNTNQCQKYQVEEAAADRDVRDIGRPGSAGRSHQLAQQIREDLVPAPTDMFGATRAFRN